MERGGGGRGDDLPRGEMRHEKGVGDDEGGGGGDDGGGGNSGIF